MNDIAYENRILSTLSCQELEFMRYKNKNVRDKIDHIMVNRSCFI